MLDRPCSSGVLCEVREEFDPRLLVLAVCGAVDLARPKVLPMKLNRHNPLCAWYSLKSKDRTPSSPQDRACRNSDGKALLKVLALIMEGKCEKKQLEMRHSPAFVKALLSRLSLLSTTSYEKE